MTEAQERAAERSRGKSAPRDEQVLLLRKAGLSFREIALAIPVSPITGKPVTRARIAQRLRRALARGATLSLPEG